MVLFEGLLMIASVEARAEKCKYCRVEKMYRSDQKKLSFHIVGESASHARPQTQWTLGRMRTSTTQEDKKDDATLRRLMDESRKLDATQRASLLEVLQSM